MKKILINVLRGLGVRPKKLGKMFNLSRATIYRHLDK